MSNSHGSFLERLFIRLKFGFIFCNVCGRVTKIKIRTNNLREDGNCKRCHSFTRKRHIAFVLLSSIKTTLNISSRSLTDIPDSVELALYNIESNGALHDHLKHTKGYISSEYFGPYSQFGHEQNGVLNVDLMDTPFENDRFNYIISTEVFEHIPDPYLAFRETHRILKKGGSHIFTVPYSGDADDEIRASMNEKGEIIYLMEPQYHGDPVRANDGILVFTIFGKEMLSKLEEIGFTVSVDERRNALIGILGGCTVFTAIKK